MERCKLLQPRLQQANSVTPATTATNKATYSSDGNVGIDVIPRMTLNPSTIAYVRLGYIWADLEGSDTVTATGFAPVSSSSSNWEGGFHWGVGIESAFYLKNWSVRAEYTYTTFNDVNNDLGTFENPTDNQFMVGLLYHFA